MKSPTFKPITVQVEDNKKKSRFNLSHDVNTSYDWGSVQPLLSQLMLPDSSINVNMEQLTRLAPMPVPTFGRVKIRNIVHSVPFKEIFPNWEYFLAQKPVTRPTATGFSEFIPNVLPHVNSSILTAMALAGCKMNVYVSGAVGGDFPNSEHNWHCYRPAAGSAWETALTALGSFLFGSYDSTHPYLGTPNIEIPAWNYRGFAISTWKLTSGNAPRGVAITAYDDFFVVPTVTTMKPAPIFYEDEGFEAAGWTHGFLNSPNPYGSYPTEKITFKGADLIWESYIDGSLRAAGSNSIWRGFANSTFDGCKIRITFKLSSFGKRLRKVLIGLGYNFSLTDQSQVSILPLLAFYKGYWDSYAPLREKNFYTTNAWKLIQFFSESNNHCNIDARLDDTALVDFNSTFKKFISDIGTCFATEKINAISAATEDMVNTDEGAHSGIWSSIGHVLDDWYTNVTAGGFIQNDMVPSLEHLGGDSVQDWAGLPALRQNNAGVNAVLSKPELDVMMKAYVYVNKRSVVGQNMAEILRINGQGKYVEECSGLFVASSDTQVKISDVISQASTEGAQLGQYGGRGLGVSADKFSFKTDKHCYLIMLSAVIPESGYVNGPDVTHEAVQFSDFYNSMFDGINYEALRKKQVVASVPLQVQGDNSCNDTFGYLPTFSSWKFTNNKCNGDFSLNSMKSSLGPYILDKKIPVDTIFEFQSETDSSGNESIVDCDRFSYSDLPNAGEDYRYINKFPWNGDYNTIFTAVDDGIEWVINSTNNDSYLYNSFEYDNFLVHNVFEIAYQAPMKAIEDSYSTYDEGELESRGGVSRS